MRVCTLKANGRLLESQTGNDVRGLQVLANNAAALGYLPDQINVMVVTDVEFEAIMAAELAASPMVPESVSDRQFYQQLAVLGVITQDEALASNAAVIPDALLTLVSGLPSDEQFGAKMLLGGATVFYRHHPMTISMGAAYGWSDAQIDGFFIAAATLL